MARQGFGFVHLETPYGGRSLPMPVVFDRAEPQRWEYHVLTIDPREDEALDETVLGKLGAEGWLLAGVLPYPSGGADSAKIVYYFVRAAD
jgi:hypothetical protein